MLSTLVFIFAAMFYLFMGGVCGRAFYNHRTVICGKHGKSTSDYDYCLQDHAGAAAVFGAMWPFTILIAAGVAINGLPEKIEKRAKAKKDRAALNLRESREAELSRLEHEKRVQQKRNELLKSQLPEGVDLDMLIKDAQS